ncbi:DUF2147 domain-containing protein [Suttonella ornithocola]|uniref:Uncharacterized protein conserved in bacteria n=1 Tax=Suttonella ornithocola TaxID=279832 RepID=A0A380MZ10_9GAMM|nr:DUF2147 domain-containing protein [Suttonella ornithocola]SUO97552.1 Uncharacterized protein conserved in bacteria [Suttonella ornithocola]
MKKAILAGILLTNSLISYATSPEGNWINLDDKTGQKKAIVNIIQTQRGELIGKIIKLLQKPGAICDKCTGNNKNKPIEGMVILWGLKPDGENEWTGGEILDPSSGKTYKLKIKLSSDGKTLEVHGYIGVSLLGRTQVWQKQ